MSTGWNILVVDDEEDVHTVTRIALRRRLWRQRPFHVTSARSAAQALATLRSPGCPSFNVALIDVVMETPTAGLELCRHIRARCPSSLRIVLRIVLRTGQPGSGFEGSVLDEYDIDYYLSKPEVTAEKLFAVIRACLRSSQDISTLMAFGRQLRNFTRALQSVTSVRDLLVFMDEALGFLEAKHDASIVFVHDIRAAEQQGEGVPLRHGAAPPPVLAAMEAVFARGAPLFTLQRGDALDQISTRPARCSRRTSFGPTTSSRASSSSRWGSWGRIGLEDPEGGGSRFVIELPAVVPRRDDEPSSEASSSEA